MLLRVFQPATFARLRNASSISRSSYLPALSTFKRSFASSPREEDDEGNENGSNEKDRDDDNPEAEISRAQTIRGALVQPGIPRPPVMLALKVSKPVMPGVMHHMFVNDAAWIKALREQAKDRVFYVGAFWQKGGDAEPAVDETSTTDGLENIEETLTEIQKTSGTTDTVPSPAAEEQGKKVQTPAERAAAEAAESAALAAQEESEREAKLNELLVGFKENEPEKKKEEPAPANKRRRGRRGDAGKSETDSESAPTRVSPLALAEMHSVGTMCRVYWQQTVLADAPIMLALIGLHRVKAVGSVEGSSPLLVKMEHHPEPAFIKGDPLKAHAREIQDLLNKMFEKTQSAELGRFLHNVDWTSSYVPDLALYHIGPDAARLQTMLETPDLEKRYKLALDFVKKDFEVLKLQEDIRKETNERFAEMQKKMMLMEQYRKIRKELGLNKDEKTELAKKYIERLKRKPIPKDVMTALKEQFDKLASLEPTSPEYGIVRTYLDWLTELPWGQYTKDNFDLQRAKETLDADHYGMDKVKERILEFVAVGRLRGNAAHGKILCLIGPPGVGKTSIGRSIARALDRQFYRIAVGGMHDISEIKGHRRTYIGAMPGKLVQGLKSAKSFNPVILIDEIDKIAPHGRHDPSAAMLEVLDPEQNKTFMDHYLDVPCDLSKVLFVCTANLDDGIPGPLADRMEFIRLSGYVANEKVAIAKQYLMPAAERQTGVESTQLRIDDDALHALIRGYCREAGVRNLQQHVERIYRKAAYQIVTKGIEQAALDAEKVTNEALAAKGIQVVPNPDATAKACISVTAENLHMFVGQPVFTSDRLYNQLLPGVCTGLAWTSMGGSTLYTECVVSDSAAQQGSLKASGHLKDVIRESCDVAYTVAKAYLAKIDAKSDFFRRSALHLHLPEGGTPKDGPSAGITITCTLLSLALNAPVRSDVAMTGEITLTGRVLPIGGVKEKAIGARRSGITTLIFPRNNKKDWDELPSHITEGMTAHFVEWYDEVFEVAFAPEIVAKARAAREVTRRQAIEQFEKERKGEAAPAEIEVEAESSSEKGKGKGKGKGKKKPAVKPTFVVAPRWATVGTPPDVLQRELADQSSTAAPTAVSAAKQL